MSVTEDGTRAVIYARISLDTTGRAEGVGRQVEDCRRMCDYRGWDVVEVVEDNSQSAREGKVRPGWAQVLGMVERGEVDVIAAWKLDRVTRSLAGLVDLVDLSKRTGVGVAFVDTEVDLMSASGRMLAGILGSVAQGEIEAKGERQVRAHVGRRKAGRGWFSAARRPFGYDVEARPQGGRKYNTLVVREEEAAVLRQMYRDALDGKPLHRITRDLNDRGITTTLGKGWRSTTVRQLLLAPRNIAVVTDKGEELPDVEADWPPVIDVETFRAVERLLNTPGRRAATSTRRKGLLTGVLRCEHTDDHGKVCGGRMGLASQVQGTEENRKRYAYYACRKGHNSWPVEWLDKHLTESALHMLNSDDFTATWQTSAPSDDVAALERERQRLARLVEELLDDRTEGLINRAQWRQRHTKATERLAAVEERLDAMSAGHDSPMLTMGRSERLARWEGMDTDERRSFILDAFGEVGVRPRGRGNRSFPDRHLLTFTRNDVVNRWKFRAVAGADN